MLNPLKRETPVQTIIWEDNDKCRELLTSCAPAKAFVNVNHTLSDTVVTSVIAQEGKRYHLKPGFMVLVYKKKVLVLFPTSDKKASL